jgi:hypothetical protein
MTATVVHLSPSASKRLVEAIDERRLAYGWTRGRLAEKANASLHGTGPLTENLLDAWAYRLRTGQPMRVELEKALALLAAFGYASNRLNGLVAELDSAVVSLLDDAASVATAGAA